jgi:hypothetical protein
MPSGHERRKVHREIKEIRGRGITGRSRDQGEGITGRSGRSGGGNHREIKEVGES